MAQALNPELSIAVCVRSAQHIAHDIRQFDLVADGGADLPAFTPGAHILVQAPNGVARRYSLCGVPAERGRYSIAVKREATGRGGSRSMVDEVKVGDMLYVSAPRNDFELAARAPGFVFIAGGIGITPIRSMIRHLAAAGDTPWKLYYLTREPAATAYHDELRALGAGVTIHHDLGDPARSFDLWPLLETPRGHHLYCCGPTALMDAVRDMTGHWSSATVHFEDFAVRPPPHDASDTPFAVRVGNDVIEVGADESILLALRARGYRVRSSCESGTCGTCRTRLISGEADHRDLVLTEEERRTNIMVCVSRARSPELELEIC
jgi:phthalate 4,5-dioxygenase reductase subunit